MQKNNDHHPPALPTAVGIVFASRSKNEPLRRGTVF